VPLLGIIAEDNSDCDALIVLIRRMLPTERDQRPGFRKLATKGCCRNHTKADATMRMWHRDGVQGVIIVHDLDRSSSSNTLNDEADLRQRLEQATANAPCQRLICIPVEEIEAWFWCDQAVLDRVAGEPNKAKARPEPHLVVRPKEALERLSQGLNRKPRYDTSVNAELAGILNIDLCTARCRAFAELRTFVGQFAA
jgi:hypothetical protein